MNQSQSQLSQIRLARLETKNYQLLFTPVMLCDQKQKEIVRFAIDSFGFIVKGIENRKPNQRFTYAEFADRIAKVYDENTPQTKEVIRVLREVDAFNRNAESVAEVVVVMPREQVLELMQGYFPSKDFSDYDDDELRLKLFTAFTKRIVPESEIRAKAAQQSATASAPVQG